MTFLVLSVSVSLAQTSSDSQSGASASVNVINPGDIRSRIRTVPSAIAPGLAAAGIETCLGSASAGGSGMGWGFSLGGTVKDEGCEARLDARTLDAMGMRDAALFRLCQQPKIATALAQSGNPCPQHRRAVQERSAQAVTDVAYPRAGSRAAARMQAAPSATGERVYNYAEQRWEAR